MQRLIVGVEDPGAMEDIAAGGGGPVDMVDIMVATEVIIEGIEAIVGIMAGRVEIMAEAISTEDPASTSVDTLGSLTTTPTGIILPLTTILINRMPYRQ